MRISSYDIMDEVAQNGGGTWCLNDGYLPWEGYFVALGGQFGQVLPNNKANAITLANFIRKHYASLTGRGVYLGVWRDKKSGKTWYDLVECVEGREEAVALGRQREQIAVWDIARQEEVPC